MLAKSVPRKVLLLQGPNGPFFRRFARELEARGCQVWKINFNGGDRLFYGGPRALAFRGRPAEWPAYLRRVLRDKSIDAIFLFGDGRPLHRAAVKQAEALGIPALVFEEGYLRPDHITLERHGVNGHSRMPRDPDAYRGAQERFPRRRPQPVGATFGRAALHATLYSLATALLAFRYPHYRHHRPLNPLWQAFCWVRGYLRKLRYRLTERPVERALASELSGHYFLMPLQVHCDYQLAHSPFATVGASIRFVLHSFAEHAPQDAHLVLKHHPMDRAYRDWGGLIHRHARALGVTGRVHYVHDAHLPSLLKAARGVVTVNSTVGLSAIHHRCPTKTLGKAVYDLPGLTHQGDLRDFWRAPSPPDRDLYLDFRAWLEHHNQANGNFHRPLPGIPTPTGVRWFHAAQAPSEPAPADEAQRSDTSITLRLWELSR